MLYCVYSYVTQISAVNWLWHEMLGTLMQCMHAWYGLVCGTRIIPVNIVNGDLYVVHDKYSRKDNIIYVFLLSVFNFFLPLLE